jgi:hypothetical protein
MRWRGIVSGAAANPKGICHQRGAVLLLWLLWSGGENGRVANTRVSDRPLLGPLAEMRLLYRARALFRASSVPRLSIGGFASSGGLPPSHGCGSHRTRGDRRRGRGPADRAGCLEGRPARSGFVLAHAPRGRPAAGGSPPRKTPDAHQVGASVRGGLACGGRRDASGRRRTGCGRGTR